MVQIILVVLAAFVRAVVTGGDPTYQGAGLLFDKGYAVFLAGVHGLRRSTGRAPPTIGG